MKIRTATLQDLEYIMEGIGFLGLEEEAINPNLYSSGYHSNSQTVEVAGELVHEDYYIFIAEEDNNKIGFVYVHLQGKHKFWKYEKLAHIDYLYIDKKYRLRGYAYELCDFFEGQVKKLGADSIRLKVLYGNTKAGNLYNKLGFQQVASVLDKKI